MTNLKKIYKTLTRNDTGETRSHQSGITIPKVVADSGIFPNLSVEILNPRESVIFYDEDGNPWKFEYIYYNDVFHGKPKTKGHNEHRLTCTKEFIKTYNLVSGDEIWFSINENGTRNIGFIKEAAHTLDNSTEVTIKIGRGWHCIKI